MGEFDPVSWDRREAALGPPAPEVTEIVEQMEGAVQDATPYDAVKTLHDAVYEKDIDRTVPSVGEPFITAYLLEKNGVIAPDEDDPENEYRSLVERRPQCDRLRELFWEQHRPLWWIGIQTGVHPSLVTYWLYEFDIPLMERNYAPESLDQIRAHREAGDR